MTTTIFKWELMLSENGGYVHARPITAKDFRTWAACREMLARLITIEPDKIKSAAILKELFMDVATLLGHTPNICKTCYVHPKIISMWEKKELISWYKRCSQQDTKDKDKDKLLLLWMNKFFNS